MEGYKMLNGNYKGEQSMDSTMSNCKAKIPTEGVVTLHDRIVSVHESTEEVVKMAYTIRDKLYGPSPCGNTPPCDIDSMEGALGDIQGDILEAKRTLNDILNKL